MQDAPTIISAARLDELLGSIAEVRRALETYHDRKTEAMIGLDCFAYDIQKVEEERTRLRTEIEEARSEADQQASIFQKQIRELTDQLQALKFENESLKSELTSQGLSLQGLSAEVEYQKRLRIQQKENHDHQILALEAAHQKALNDAIETEKKIQVGLVGQLTEASQQRDEAELRLATAERSLSHIRTHMLGVLQTGSSGKVKPSDAPEMKTIEAVSRESASTVDDYLKRLGY